MSHPDETDRATDAVRRMDVGIGLPIRTADAAPGILLQIAARAEAGPFSTLAVADRVVFAAQEPLIALGAVIGVTKRIRLMTSAILAPTRETTLLARQAATLDSLSAGRFSLGIGVGVREDDYEATGYAFHARGSRLDGQLADLRRIWAHDAPVRATGPIGAIGPSPARAGGPELLIGGYVDAVARRIATWGDGFLAPGGGEATRMMALWERIKAAWTAAGRAGVPRWVGASYYALGPTALDAAREHIDAWYGFDPALAERRLAGIPTTPEAVLAAIRGNEAMGVDEFILRPCVADLDQVDALADLVDGSRR